MFARAWVLFCVAVLAPMPASAHAFLEHASPDVGATVHVVPRQLRLWFSERLEAAFSRVAVLDARGRDVTAGRLKAAPGNPKELVVPLKPLAPGVYTVHWRAVSVDTHVTQGGFEFTVAR